MDASGQHPPLPEEDPLIPQLPVGFPVCHKPCLWITPSRIGAPKREREGEASSSDEEMRDRDTKRRTSATDKGDQDLATPSDVQMTTTIELSGKYGAAPSVLSGLRYDLGSVLQNPLRPYPSPSAMYGMELDGTLVKHPVFSTNFGAGQTPNRVFSRGYHGAMALDRVLTGWPGRHGARCNWGGPRPA